MNNRIPLCLVVLILSGCSTYYEAKNCDSEKNYVNSNPEEIEKYNRLLSDGKINSFYLKITPTPSCVNNNCFSYDTKKYDFFEMYFNDSTRQGIYTIRLNTIEGNTNCFKKPYSYDTKCYIVTKNENNEIKSQYSLEKINENNSMYRKFMDIKNNKILFESSYQAYHKASISGEPSGDVCKVSKNNNPKYKFKIFDYPKQ